MKVVIATHNPSKFQRYKRLLREIDSLELLSLSDIGITEKVDEPFETAKENAMYKAEKYAEMSGLPTLAIDEATRTNFLPENEQPGVYVRRFADRNHEMSDAESLVTWQKVFEKYPQVGKEFLWDFSIVYIDPIKILSKYTKAVMVSHVADTFSSTIEPGYPMSSFLIADGSPKPFAELTDEEKLEVDKKIFHEFINLFSQWIRE